MTRFVRNLLLVTFAAVGVFAFAGSANAATPRPAAHAAWVAPCTNTGHDGITRGREVMWSYRQWRPCPTGHVSTASTLYRWWFPARRYGHAWF